MEKKTECEIVQDLLLGYVDKTLNDESKKLVEKHLSECEKCRQRLQDIKKDIEENQSTQKKEIDYLKKVRRKSRIKAFFIAIGILLLIAIIYYVIKFIRISSIMNKASKNLESENMYFEQQQILDDEKVAILKLYYKDGKYKQISQIYSDDEIQTQFLKYGEVDSNEIIEIDDINKVVTIKHGDIVEAFNKKDNIKWSRFGTEERNSIVANMGKAFLMSIYTDNYGSNKEYYVLTSQFDRNKRWEIWIDKETGLVIKEINRDSEKSFITGTDIVKEINDTVISYNYEFNVVTDEDVKVPDLSEYKIENVNEKFEDYME